MNSQSDRGVSPPLEKWIRRLPTLRRFGDFALPLAAFTSWGRVFLGLHFPFDIGGSMIVAVISLMLVRPLRPWIDARLAPLAERAHVRIFWN